MILLYDKMSTIQVSENLNQRELACKCEDILCRYTFLEETIPGRFEAIRQAWRSPLIITSGFRCINHNGSVGGKVNSRHIIGHAIDIFMPAWTNPLLDRGEELLKICGTHFDYVEWNKEKGYIHCHIEPRR
jgi:hypothetical protein